MRTETERNSKNAADEQAHEDRRKTESTFKRYRTSIILLVIALLVGAGYFFKFEPMMEERRLLEDFQKRFFRSNPEDIRMVRIRLGTGGVDVARESSGWVVAGKYKADRGAIERFFEVLASGRILKTVGHTSDRKKFGFDRPELKIVLAFADRVESLEIAGKNPSGSGYYAYSKELGRIFLVNEELARDLRLGTFELREKRFFPVEAGAIGKIVLKRKHGTMELKRTDAGWHVEGPLKGEGSSADIEWLLDIVTTQRAEGFVGWKPEYGKLPGHLEMRLFDRDMRPMDGADIYYWGTEWNRGTLVHRGGSQEAARTRREFWNNINTDVSVFLKRNLFAVEREEISGININWSEGDFRMMRDGQGWRYGDKPVPEDKAAELLDHILRWRAKKLVREDRELGKEQFSIRMTTLGGLTESVVVSDFNMDYEVSSTPLSAPVEPGSMERAKVDFWYTRSSSLEYGAITSSLDLKGIIRQIESIVKG